MKMRRILLCLLLSILILSPAVTARDEKAVDESDDYSITQSDEDQTVNGKRERGLEKDGLKSAEKMQREWEELHGLDRNLDQDERPTNEAHHHHSRKPSKQSKEQHDVVKKHGRPDKSDDKRVEDHEQASHEARHGNDLFRAINQTNSQSDDTYGQTDDHSADETSERPRKSSSKHPKQDEDEDLPFNRDPQSRTFPHTQQPGVNNTHPVNRSGSRSNNPPNDQSNNQPITRSPEVYNTSNPFTAPQPIPIIDRSNPSPYNYSYVQPAHGDKRFKSTNQSSIPSNDASDDSSSNQQSNEQPEHQLVDQPDDQSNKQSKDKPARRGPRIRDESHDEFDNDQSSQTNKQTKRGISEPGNNDDEESVDQSVNQSNSPMKKRNFDHDEFDLNQSNDQSVNDRNNGANQLRGEPRRGSSAHKHDDQREQTIDSQNGSNELDNEPRQHKPKKHSHHKGDQSNKQANDQSNEKVDLVDTTTGGDEVHMLNTGSHSSKQSFETLDQSIDQSNNQSANGTQSQQPFTKQASKQSFSHSFLSSFLLIFLAFSVGMYVIHYVYHRYRVRSTYQSINQSTNDVDCQTVEIDAYSDLEEALQQPAPKKSKGARVY